MDKLVHFAKVLGITWAIAMALYFVVIRLGGFSVGWSGQSPPSMGVIQVMFYAWPAVLAFLGAALLEWTRLAMFRRH
jgi:Na+/melibiose symporter-like transporter